MWLRVWVLVLPLALAACIWKSLLGPFRSCDSWASYHFVSLLHRRRRGCACESLANSKSTGTNPRSWWHIWLCVICSDDGWERLKVCVSLVLCLPFVTCILVHLRPKRKKFLRRLFRPHFCRPPWLITWSVTFWRPSWRTRPEWVPRCVPASLWFYVTRFRQERVDEVLWDCCVSRVQPGRRNHTCYVNRAFNIKSY